MQIPTDRWLRESMKDGAIPTALLRVRSSALFEQFRNLGDWQAGEQLGTPGTDFLATTLAEALDASETTFDVASVEGFPVPGANADIGTIDRRLIITDGTDIEIVEYTTLDIDNDQFEGITRGAYGTTAQTWDIGDDVYFLEFSGGINPSNDLGLSYLGLHILNDTGAPGTGRVDRTIVYDRQNHQLIAFGGRDSSGGGTIFNDVWVLPLATMAWTQKTPAGGPSARAGFCASWDDARNVMVISCGNTDVDMDDAFQVDETWEYDPDDGAQGSWAQTDDCPIQVDRHAMGWDPGTQKMIMSYGREGSGWNQDAYSYDGAAAATFQWVKISNNSSAQMEVAPSEYHVIIGRQVVMGNTSAGGGTWQARLFDVTTGLFDDPRPASVPFGFSAPISVAIDPITASVLFWRRSSGPGDMSFYKYGIFTNLYERLENAKGLNQIQGHSGVWDFQEDRAIWWGGSGQFVGTDPDVVEPWMYQYHPDDMSWRSVMDVGETPTNDGKVVIDDVILAIGESTIQYELEHSDSALGPWTPIGIVTNGQILTDWKRYWRVKVDSTTNARFSPTTQKFRIQFDELFSYVLADDALFGYPPLIKSVPSLTSKADFLKAKASISELTVELVEDDAKSVSQLIKNFRVYGQKTELLIGFDAPDFTENDYLPYLTGLVVDHEWDGKTLRLFSRDALSSLKDEIPPDQDAGVPTPIAYNVGTISNPMDIMRDILENRLNINGEYINVGSFDNIRDNFYSDHDYLRTINDPEKGEDLIHEIGAVSRTIVVPTENGELTLKRIDPDAPASVTLDDRTILKGTPKMKLDKKFLRNVIAVYFGNDQGEKPSDYNITNAGAVVNADDDSIKAWNVAKVERILSKWLGKDDVTYKGKDRAQETVDSLLALFRNAAPKVRLKTGFEFAWLQAVDIIQIQEGFLNPLWFLPFLIFGLDEPKDLRFFINQKQLQWRDKTIQWELQLATSPFILTIDTFDEWSEAIQ